MAAPEKHALLSASSAERWLHCTRAPRLEESMPETDTDYTREGRVAHAVAELKVRKYFTPMATRSYNSALKKLQADPAYSEEMLGHADTYVEYLAERAMQYKTTPTICTETEYRYDAWVPEGFGTCDCTMISGDVLQVTDYKYGKGVEVSAEDNPQLKLYALGAYLRYSIFFAIKTVRLAIVQPRIRDDVSEYEMPLEDLLAWGESIKPVAQAAFDGEGNFSAGEWCRWCRAKKTCRARSENYTALQDFDGAVPPLLSDAEVGEILQRAAGLKAWISDLEDYALKSTLDGREIPGWKAVEGRSVRQWTDQDAALEAAVNAGYPREIIYDYVPKSLSQLEKLLGAQKFADILAPYVTKPAGKPTLVPADDKRPAYSSAAADFKGVCENV